MQACNMWTWLFQLLAVYITLVKKSSCLPTLELQSTISEVEANGMRVAIITAQTRKNGTEAGNNQLLHLAPEYTDMFLQNKKGWAHYQGYDYINSVVEVDDDGDATSESENLIQQSIQFLKIDLVLKYLSDYDWIVWLDMDMIVVDYDGFKLEDFIYQAEKARPQVDLIVEGRDDYRAYNGDALKSGLMFFRNSLWSKRLLKQMKDVLSDEEWQGIIKKSMSKRGSSYFDEALVYLLNSDHFSDPHVYLMHLQNRWNQEYVYLPKIGLLHFNGCTLSNLACLDVFNKAISHLLLKEQFYVYLAAPYIQHIYNIFVGIYVLFALDRLFHILGRYLGPNRRKHLPKATLPIPSAKPLAVLCFPFVVVQLPMYNESSCCQTIIDACCRFEWPSCRLLIQVVDDSTNEETKVIIDRRVKHWRAKGINIVVERRLHREGFKAGAMNEAMKKFPEDAEYIAIFDADFLPYPKFLRQTVPYLMADSKVGFVQTCWIYTNSKESILTRMQEISLNFHFNCEQEMRFRCKKFFNFNGTAGVWRKAAIDDSGGWHTDTLVEDMDLSLRAFANGWDFVYLHDVKVLNEIPPTFSAYRGQQHRWTSGPMQVLKKAFKTIFSSNHLSFIDKAFCIWFFVRNYVHVINFVYFLVLVPLMIWVPRVTLYEWALVYLPCAISMSNIFFTPKEALQVVIYVLFENAMCLYKTGALICGVLNIGKAKQWIVTPKYARKTVLVEGAEENMDILKKEEIADLVGSSSEGTLTPVSDNSGEISDDRESNSPSQIVSSNRMQKQQQLYLPPVTPALTPKHNPAHTSYLFEVYSSPPRSLQRFDKMNNNISPLPQTLKKSKTRRIIPLSTAYQLSLWLKPTTMVHWKEILMGGFLMICSYYGFLMRQTGIASFCFLNAIAYYVLGLGYIGRSG